MTLFTLLTLYVSVVGAQYMGYGMYGMTGYPYNMMMGQYGVNPFGGGMTGMYGGGYPFGMMGYDDPTGVNPYAMGMGYGGYGMYGMNGLAGMAGINGMNGLNGMNAMNGMNGINGMNGVSNTNGAGTINNGNTRSRTSGEVIAVEDVRSSKKRTGETRPAPPIFLYIPPTSIRSRTRYSNNQGCGGGGGCNTGGWVASAKKLKKT